MDNKIITVRKTRLEGAVSISGAKNSSLKLLTASILTSGEVFLPNFPIGLLDVQVHIGMLKALGKNVSVEGTNNIKITEVEQKKELEWVDRSIRNTLLMLGCLLTRYGYGKVPLPGGCKLGERKYDIHVMVFELFGAKVWEDDNYLYAESPQKLKGTDIHLPMRSTGATENAILCATLAIGKTTIWNPHIRPEVIDLIDMLRKQGAKISVYGQQRIEIEGTDHLVGCEHQVIPDNMEALTWLIASVVTNGDIELKNFPYEHLEIPLIHLRESGAKFYKFQDELIVKGGKCYPIDISTGPYPGINSDMQPLFAVYGTLAKGESKIVDLRFPGRYGYALELAKMGAKNKIVGDMLVIDGGHALTGSTVKALDLRAGIALLLAGLTAEGETTIENAWQIERGYENIIDKLSLLSAGVLVNEL